MIQSKTLLKIPTLCVSFLTFQVYFDYSLFYDDSGEEARKCTEAAIRDRNVITGTTFIYMWQEDPETTRRNPTVVGRAMFYCALRDMINTKRIVGEFKGYRYTPGLTKFYIG